MVFFDWIDRDFVSKRISWFRFVGLVNGSLCVLCRSQPFLVICFWMMLAKSYKELNVQKSPWKTLVMSCWVSPFGFKDGYSGTDSPNTSKLKIALDTFWLEQRVDSGALGNQLEIQILWKQAGKQWKNHKACQELWLWRRWGGALRALVLPGCAGSSTSLVGTASRNNSGDARAGTLESSSITWIIWKRGKRCILNKIRKSLRAVLGYSRIRKVLAGAGRKTEAAVFPRLSSGGRWNHGSSALGEDLTTDFLAFCLHWNESCLCLKKNFGC